MGNIRLNEQSGKMSDYQPMSLLLNNYYLNKHWLVFKLFRVIIIKYIKAPFLQPTTKAHVCVCLLAKYLLNHGMDFIEPFRKLDLHLNTLHHPIFNMAATASWPYETKNSYNSQFYGYWSKIWCGREFPQTHTMCVRSLRHTLVFSAPTPDDTWIYLPLNCEQQQHRIILFIYLLLLFILVC